MLVAGLRRYHKSGSKVYQGIVLRQAFDELEDRYSHVIQDLHPVGMHDNKHGQEMDDLTRNKCDGLLNLAMLTQQSVAAPSLNNTEALVSNDANLVPELIESSPSSPKGAESLDSGFPESFTATECEGTSQGPIISVYGNENKQN